MKSDLLADLRADVEAAAQAEQDQRAASKAARLAEEARAEAEARAAEEAAVAMRLEIEARRQALLVQARVALAQPAPAVEPVQAPAVSVAAIEPLVIAEPPAAHIDPPRSAGFWLAVMGVPLVCATAITIAVIWSGATPTASPVITPPAPVLQVVDAPSVPDAPLMPTAHIIATPASEATPMIKTPKTRPTPGVIGKRVRKRPPPKAQPKAPKSSTFTLGSDFMKAD